MRNKDTESNISNSEHVGSYRSLYDSVNVLGTGPAQNILFCKINPRVRFEQPISILIDVISWKFFQSMIKPNFPYRQNNYTEPDKQFPCKVKFCRRLDGVWRVSRVQLTWLSLLFLSDFTSLHSPSPACCGEPGQTGPPWTDTTAWSGAAVRTPPTPLGSRRRCSARRDRRTFLPNLGNRGSASGNPRNNPL